MYKILIAENIPTLNKGELAILEGMLESFKLLDDKFEVSILSALPNIDRQRYSENIKIIKADFLNIYGDILNYPKKSEIFTSIIFAVKHFIFLFLYKILNYKVLNLMKSPIWKAYLDSDVIFIGHNGVFGLGTRIIPEKNLITYFSYLFLPFFGSVIKKPLVIYAGSIPPFKQNQRFLWRWISFLLSRVDLITLREEKSLENLYEIGYSENKAFVTADIAFLLEADIKTASQIMNKEGIDYNNGPLVGFTITREIASTAFAGLGPKKSYKKHVNQIAEFLDDFINVTNAKIVFLPHSIGFGEKYDDRLVSEDIYRICKNKKSVYIIKNEYSPAELKGIMNYFDFFIGERLHSVIGALSMKIPSIVITYHKDQRIGIINDLCDENIAFCSESVNKEDFLLNVINLWNNRLKIKKQLNIQIENKKQKALCNVKLLKKLLES